MDKQVNSTSILSLWLKKIVNIKEWSDFMICLPHYSAQEYSKTLWIKECTRVYFTPIIDHVSCTYI